MPEDENDLDDDENDGPGSPLAMFFPPEAVCEAIQCVMGADACAEFVAGAGEEGAAMVGMCSNFGGVEAACSSCGASEGWSTCEKYECLLGSSTCANAFGAYGKAAVGMSGEAPTMDFMTDEEVAMMLVGQVQTQVCPEFGSALADAQMKIGMACMECSSPPSEDTDEEDEEGLTCTEDLLATVQCMKDNAECSTAIAEAPEFVQLQMKMMTAACEEQDDDDAADDDDDAANAHCYAVAGAVSALTAAVL
jgi:hypothetical protein